MNHQPSLGCCKAHFSNPDPFARSDAVNSKLISEMLDALQPAIAQTYAAEWERLGWDEYPTTEQCPDCGRFNGQHTVDCAIGQLPEDVSEQWLTAAAHDEVVDAEIVEGETKVLAAKDARLVAHFLSGTGKMDDQSMIEASARLCAYLIEEYGFEIQ